MNKWGITDVPIAIDRDKDIFSIKSYIDGLEKFIENCPTPMSIALQGDWGTGKTTFLKTIEKDFKYKDNIKTVYFNTWAYSQFNDSDGLYFSLISNIISQLHIGDNKIKEKANKLLKKIITVSSLIVKSFLEKKISDITGLESEDFEEILNDHVEKVEDQSTAIQNLKDDYAGLINSIVDSIEKKHGQEKKARIVICIDDLDRLEPKRAVEVLEVFKLFMDVKNCVYLLAIDYNVVVSGVRSKYDSQMSEEKCRAFFDKIIQLPFSMPVQHYQIRELLNNFFENEFFGSYEKTICYFIQNNLGNNPRTIKRFLNRCCLLSTILEVNRSETPLTQDKEYYSLILLIIAFQMCNEKAYMAFLNKFNEDDEAVKAWLEDTTKTIEWLRYDGVDKGSTEEKVALSIALSNLRDAYIKIKNEYTKESGENKLIELFCNLLILSVTTSLGIKKSESLFCIDIDGEQFEEKQHSKSMVQLIENLFKKVEHDKISELTTDINMIRRLRNWMTFDDAKVGSVFRSRLRTPFNNETLYIGVSSNSTTKTKQMKHLITYLKHKQYIDKKIKISWTKYLDGKSDVLLNV